MGSVSELGNYLADELHRRDLSPEDFGRRSGLTTSHIYQIIRGRKTDLRQSTVDRIAAALGMSTAELMTIIGKGRPDENPRRVTLGALLRLVSDDELGTVEKMLRPFAVPPTQRRSIGRRDRRSIRSKQTKAQLEHKGGQRPNLGAEDTEAPCYSPLRSVLHAEMRPLAAALGA